MFCIIYRFKVKSGRDSDFTKAWSEVTEAFVDHCGGWGSRLHKSEDGEYIAYAQWPLRDVRDAAQLPDSVKNGASVVMRDSCELIETLYELTPTVDHLKSVAASGD